ncbi:O-antigen ligase family protein [Ectothiorhodospira shaposhnikovii]|nr:O-antigen ligase family protein [Ectothiorhodospira shaposhnikovii]
MPNSRFRAEIPVSWIYQISWLILTGGFLFVSRLPDLLVIGQYGSIALALAVVVLLEKSVYWKNQAWLLYVSLVIWAVVIVPISPRPDLALSGAYTMLGIAVLWYASHRIIMNVRSISFAVAIFLVAFLAQGSYGLVSGDFTEMGMAEQRIAGALGNPNSFGFQMLYGALGALFLLALNRWGRIPVTLIWIIFGFFILMMIFSGSRKTAIAAAIVLALILALVLRRHLQNLILVIVFGSIAGWIFMELGVIGLSFLESNFILRDRFEEELFGRGVEARSQIIFLSLSAGLSHFPFGLGVTVIQDSTIYGRNPHNVFVDLLVSMGVVGLVLWTLILFLTLRLALRLYREKVTQSVGAVYLAFLLGFMILGLGSHQYYAPHTMFAFIVFNSLAMRVRRDWLAQSALQQSLVDRKGLQLYPVDWRRAP